MKKIFYALFAVCLSVIFLLPATIQVSAVEIEYAFKDETYNVNAVTTNQSESIVSIITNTYSQSAVSRLMSAIKVSPDDYYVDLSIYAVEHTVTVENTESGPTIIINSLHPTIYVPIWGNVDGKERIIGHIHFCYNYSKDKYMQTPVILNIQSEGFISGEQTHFLEEIGIKNDYDIIKSVVIGSETDDLILARMTNSLNYLAEKMVLVKTESGIMVYDFMNTAHCTEGSEQLILSIQAFASQRASYESTQESTRYEGMSGNNIKIAKNETRHPVIWIVSIAVVAAVFGVAIWKRVKRKTGNITVVSSESE